MIEGNKITEGFIFIKSLEHYWQMVNYFHDHLNCHWQNGHNRTSLRYNSKEPYMRFFKDGIIACSEWPGHIHDEVKSSVEVVLTPFRVLTIDGKRYEESKVLELLEGSEL